MFSTSRHHSPDGEPLPPALEGFESINRYWDRANRCFAAKILPGEFYVTREDEMITTVLGSCVAACIRDKLFGIGGMNHFMLPLDDGGGSWNGMSELARSTRYGNYAMEHMINEILKHGGRRNNLEAKVFGGGQVLTEGSDIGRKNIEFVHKFLADEGIELAGENVGDIYPRKVNYYPRTGLARMKKLKQAHNQTIISRERSYMSELRQEEVSGDIELFD
ncbi:chemoreceptor glutamine deamidase CheD [Ectothiorhodospiraceae bacterium BW-2]|nr:chemoreceptor glutamine deamidase CheD [Ectothiorhodospiraceae bacterium BW-2]